jgi:hypothetical protein
VVKVFFWFFGSQFLNDIPEFYNKTWKLLLLFYSPRGADVEAVKSDQIIYFKDKTLTGKKKEISNLSPIFESLSFFCG